jgi:hypothetical protein
MPTYRVYVSMNVSPKESTDRGGHVGPSLSQVVDRPHFGAKSPLPWWVHVLGGGIGSTDLMKSVWQRNMATQPCGDHLAVLCYRIVAAKPRNCLWDAINTPLCSPLQYTHSTVGSPLVKALVL